jgi:hypothetical protein
MEDGTTFDSSVALLLEVEPLEIRSRGTKIGGAFLNVRRASARPARLGMHDRTVPAAIHGTSPRVSPPGEATPGEGLTMTVAPANP